MLLLTPGGLHYTRWPFNYPARVRVWLWVWAWTCVVLSAGQGVGGQQQGTILQDFPIAAEENFYSFNPDGTYTFSYDTGGGEHQSFRIEMRDASGKVSGRFGYVDPAGALRITEYQADSSGYRASIEVYHQVSLAPPTPLLVGPLPKQPNSIPGPPEGPPKPPAMRPVGPAPFFPAQQPVLIIGPLPKPLQPQSNEDDQDPPDLEDDSLFTIPSDPLIPAVLPNSPLGDKSPRDTLNSPQGAVGLTVLQGTFTDILQQSSDDQEVPQIITVTASSTSTENTDQHRESVDAVVRDAGQTGASSNAQADQQLPEKPQLHLTRSNSPVTRPKNKDINPTMINLQKSAANNVPSVIFHETQENPVSDSDSEEPTHSINNDFLQPSATAIITPTISRLAERDATTGTGTATAIPASPVLVAKANKDVGTQSRMFNKPPSLPPTPPLTYLPVGVPRHQYPTAPLLHLPQHSNSYPA